MEVPFIRKAAILGAGVMGAQIAAHLCNAGIKTILYDLSTPADKAGANKNQLVEHALSGLLKASPAPLAIPEYVSRLGVANYEEHLAGLADCDLVIEAISEKMEWKLKLYQSIVPHLKPNVILGSNTSGLSIEGLKNALPEHLQSRFLGVHFFNPPRYMKLVELIPHKDTSSDMMHYLETFLVSTLGKGVVYAKDTPNFIGNRVGVFAILSMLEHAEKFGIPPDLVDDLTGPAIGRPKSATFRTMDIVGLDTMLHVVRTMREGLPSDPFASHFKVPKWLENLVEKGALGQKSGQGVYKKDFKDPKDDKIKGIGVFDPKRGEYRLAVAKASGEVYEILKEKNPALRMKKLYEHPSNEAKFLWACFRDLFYYCAYHLEEIANTVADVDLALRWGYGWAVGPFELWQMSDFTSVRNLIEKDIKENNALANVTLPLWIQNIDCVYKEGKAFNPSANDYQSRMGLPVYQKQLYYDGLLTEQFDEGKTLFENAGVRLMTLDGDIGVLSFKSKLNCVGDEVLDGILESIKICEKQCKGLVLWQRNGSDFSVGADLKQFTQTLKANDFALLERAVQKFQQVTLGLRYAQVPVVCAISGRVLGGGCEIALHCSHVVAYIETYMGLVEVGVGLLPAAGGCKEMAYRAAVKCFGADGLGPVGDLMQVLRAPFEQIAMAKVSSSAIQAKEMGYLKPSDTIVFNVNELLYCAIKQAKVMSELGYRPPMVPSFKILGKTGIANFNAALINMREGNFISDHDLLIGQKVADVICGGALEPSSIIPEQWMMQQELKAFIELARTPKTQERIVYTLEKGKPLRN